MVIIAGYMLVPASQRDAIVEAHRDLVRRAREFPGCLDLAIGSDSLDPRRINNIEVWESADALDAWRPQSDPPDTGVEPDAVEMARYDATDGGPLF